MIDVLPRFGWTFLNLTQQKNMPNSMSNRTYGESNEKQGMYFASNFVLPYRGKGLIEEKTSSQRGE